MRHCRVASVWLAVVLLVSVSTVAHAGGTPRTFSGDGNGPTRDDAIKGAIISALRTAAHDLTGQLYKWEEVSSWLEGWDDYGLSRKVMAAQRLGDGTFSASVDIQIDRDEFVGFIAGRHSAPRGGAVVMVLISEVIFLRPAPDPAAETAVKQAFLVGGYEVVNQHIADNNKVRDTVRALERGDAEAVKALRDEYNCDYIAYGEAFAEQGGGGRFNGTCELHVVQADTARELAAATGTGAAVSETPLQAGKLALKHAGEAAGSTCLSMLKHKGSPTPVQVVVNEIAYFSTAEALTKALQKIVGPDAVARPHLDLQNHTCSWDIRSTIPAAELAGQLEPLQQPRLQILEVSAQKITAKVTN